MCLIISSLFDISKLHSSHRTNPFIGSKEVILNAFKSLGQYVLGGMSYLPLLLPSLPPFSLKIINDTSAICFFSSLTNSSTHRKTVFLLRLLNFLQNLEASCFNCSWLKVETFFSSIHALKSRLVQIFLTFQVNFCLGTGGKVGFG